MHLRQATAEDAPAISALLRASFDEHVAADWEVSAQSHFHDENTPEKLASKIPEAAICLVSEGEAGLLGVIYLPRPTLVQLFFVAPGQVRGGIGRALWNAVCEELEARYPEVRTVELNSSPYAVAAYQALGFFPISKQFRRKGAVATRMACWLPGGALEEVSNAERTPIVLAPGEGRAYPMGRIAAVFKADKAESESRYSISEWWLEPHTQGPGAHSHPEDDIFYVIEGTMSVLVGEAWTHATPGSFVLVPGGVTHDFENRGDVRAGVLNLSIPGPFEPHMPGIAQWFAEHPPQDPGAWITRSPT